MSKLLSMYKIMDPEAYIDIGFEILTLNEDNHWRPLKMVPDLLLHQDSKKNTVRKINNTIISINIFNKRFMIDTSCHEVCSRIYKRFIFFME